MGSAPVSKSHPKPGRITASLSKNWKSPGSALGLMAEVFRKPGPELAGWCANVLEVRPMVSILRGRGS
jgi:hypothetical protein